MLRICVSYGDVCFLSDVEKTSQTLFSILTRFGGIRPRRSFAYVATVTATYPCQSSFLWVSEQSQIPRIPKYRKWFISPAASISKQSASCFSAKESRISAFFIRVFVEAIRL
ncbi:hypothetical protein MPH_13342 [Macrophomina phaseolina MS6]|uniref:Uncharacterized protein n=1 Tax=Macrophomina phaseolina (strain MS6) TaxID=1126212 RepID=K2R9T0_MACPH|nr:hypothetical protein MPH_13342 [Macrophomina phaseolina MS6]